MTFAIHLNSVDDTRKLGRLLGSCLQPQAFIGLVGNLGAGKTTLTQALAEQLGIDDAVSSPTFLMLNEYHSGRLPLFHFDLYRLQEDLSPESAAMLALKSEIDEVVQSGLDAVVVVEWINLWQEFATGFDELRIEMTYDQAEGRQVNISAHGSASANILSALQSRWSLAKEKEES